MSQTSIKSLQTWEFPGQRTTKHSSKGRRGAKCWTWQLAPPSLSTLGKVWRQAGGRPCHPTAAIPSYSSLGEASCASSFLHPHFRKTRLNIAKFALMSQLRAWSAATFHFGKLGRNQLDLQESSFLCLLLCLWKDHMQEPAGLWGVLRFGQADNRAHKRGNVPEMT